MGKTWTPIGQVGPVWRALYDVNETYNRNDFVKHNNDVYICLQDGTTGIAPADDGVNWNLFVGGATGAGDMLTQTYDKDEDGIVDAAEKIGKGNKFADTDVLMKFGENAAGQPTYDGQKIGSGEGGQGGSVIHILTTDFANTAVEVTSYDPITGDEEKITDAFDANGICTVNITGVGTVVAKVVDGSDTYTASVNAPYYGIYGINLNRGEIANVSITIDDDSLFTNVTVTLVNETDSTKNQTAMLTKVVNSASFAVPAGDTYHIEFGALANYSKPANTAAKVSQMSTSSNYTGAYEFIMEKVQVTLSTDTSTINVATNQITLFNVTDGTSEVKAAVGSQATFYVEHGKQFYVTVEQVPLFSQPKSATFTAVKKTTRPVALEYEYIMGEVEVTLSADTSIDVSTKQITVHDVTASTSETKTAVNGVATFNVEQGHTYYATCEEIALYLTPRSADAVAVKGQTDQVTLQYQYVMESVEVTITSDDPRADLNNNVELYDLTAQKTQVHMATNGVATFNVEQNHEYYVKACYQEYFTTTESDHYTAVKGNTRQIALQYSYNAEDITVNLSCDKAGMDVSTKEITVTDKTMNIPVTKAAVNGVATFQVIAEHDYVVSVESINGYVCADSERFTAAKNGTRTVNMQYLEFYATFNFTVPRDATSITIKRNNTTIQTVPGGSATIIYKVHETGTYEFIATKADDSATSGEIEITLADNRSTKTGELSFAAPVWGFKQTFTNTSPLNDGTGTITYPSDVVNADFTPAMTNSAQSGYVEATKEGSWTDFLDNVLKNFPYIVNKDTGEAIGKLNPNDYTKYEDGTSAPITSCDCAMSWLNKIYTKEVYDASGNFRTVYFAADNTHSNTLDFKPVGFQYKNGTEIEELEGMWLPIFYMDATGKTKANVSPIHSKTCDQEKSIIDGLSSTNKRGIFLGGAMLNLLRDLEYMIFRSTDIQKYGGYGRCNANSLAPGSTNGKDTNPVISGGRFNGNGDKKTTNKLFHSNVLGTYQQVTRDPYYITINGRLKVSPYYEYDLSGAKYVDTGITVTSNSGWTYAKKTIMKPATGEFGSIPDPASKDADSSTGLCDGQYYNASGTRVALRLGPANNDLLDGPASVALCYEASFAGWYCGVGRALCPSVGYAPA